MRSIEEPRMTAETAAPCVQGVSTMGSVAQQGQDTGGHVKPYYMNKSSTPAIYDPEYARMEAWLDEHPDFVTDYFLRLVKLFKTHIEVMGRNF